MAILDTLFGGSSQAELLGGLLGEDKLNQLRSQATQTGLINAAIGYLAQPKNQRFGSALPYLARAFTAGQQGAQGVYDDALKNWQMQQKVDEFNREKAAREARQRVLPELLGMPSAYRGTTTRTVQGEEYATPSGDVSSPFTAQFQTQRMPDTQVQTPTFNEAEYMKDLAMSGYGDKMLEAQLAQERKSPFGQVDVSKFTPESIKKFERTRVYSDLDPLEKTGKAKDFGAEIESVSMAKYNRPYSQLTQPEMANVLKEVNADKSARAPKVEVNLSDPTAVAKAGIELSEKAQKFFKEDIDTASQYNIIKSLAKNPTPTGDTTLLYSLFKVLDPTSTVREGEVNMVMESRSIPARLKGYAQKLAGGGNLLPRERQEILSIAEQRVSIRKKNFEKSRRAFVENAKRLKLDPEIYVPNPYSEMQGAGGNQGTVEVDY